MRARFERSLRKLQHGYHSAGVAILTHLPSLFRSWVCFLFSPRIRQVPFATGAIVRGNLQNMLPDITASLDMPSFPLSGTREEAGVLLIQKSKAIST